MSIELCNPCAPSFLNDYSRISDQSRDDVRPAVLLGNSAQMRFVYEGIRAAAQTREPILILGEPGTGREIVAAAIHHASARSQNPFISLNSTPASAVLTKMDQAQGGTLYVEDFPQWSRSLQEKLLDILRSGNGTPEPPEAGIRFLASAGPDFDPAIQPRELHPELCALLIGMVIPVPPLRSHRADIIPLADRFVEKNAAALKKTLRRISTEAIHVLTSYHWPGNVRELEAAIDFAAARATDGVIHAYNLPPSLQRPDPSEISRDGSLKARVDLLERDMIIDALRLTEGSIPRAADILGVTPRIVRYKIKNLGIDYARFFKKNTRCRSVTSPDLSS